MTRQGHFSLKVSRILALAFALLAVSFEAEAVRVRVAAGTRLEGRVDRNTGAASGVVIRGTLRDDVGGPVPDSHVSISFYDDGVDGTGSTAPGGAPAVAVSQSPRRCADSTSAGVRDPHVAPDEYVVDTDTLGSFCVQTTLPIERGTMKLRFLGNSHYDPTAAEVPFDVTHPSVTLSFDPEPSIASLDRPAYSVGLRVTAPGMDKDSWQVVLRDENERVLGKAAVDPDGLVRIDVPTDQLGPPGPGRLSAALEGTSLLAPPISHAIERHARVELLIATRDPRGVPEDGIPIEIETRSSRGPVTTGSVEATVLDHSVGAAPVRAGRAAIVATFAATRDSTARASLRYLPDAPWWEPSSPLTIAIAVAPPSLWRRVPAILLALAVAAWMLRGAWLPRLGRVARERRKAAPAPAQQPLEVVRTKRPDEGWSGRVVDAHDGAPLEGAIVAIVVPSFPGSESRAGGATGEVVTDHAGRFALEHAPLAGKAILRVRAPWHATFEQPLPEPSEVSVPMVARRRRLLDRLVAWAAREWGPWKGVREPTPDQIALQARLARDKLGVQGAGEVEAWARAVEWTAFGRAPVDENAEQSVASLEPSKPGRPKK